MQRVTAIIKPFKLDDAREALSNIGIEGGRGPSGFETSGIRLRNTRESYRLRLTDKS